MIRTLLSVFASLAFVEGSHVWQPTVKVAALQFSVTPTTGGPTSSKVGALVREVAEPLKTAVTLLEDGELRLCLTIPCGYTNLSFDYLTDSTNTGDGEYQSAHYRYSKFRPPHAKPAGDVIAIKAVEVLNGFVAEPAR